jgi:CCR4-NOT transcription complex subunit 2
MGLDMNSQGNLFSTFITPWSDASAAAIVEPEFHLPSCYNVQTSPPGPAKAQTFGDETLFFMFYSSPRDALQEVAAQELYNRNWRFHKEYRMWLTKETGTVATAKTSTYEQGIFTFFDPERWEKVKKEARINYDQLEEKIMQPIPGFSQMPSAPIGQITQQMQQMQTPSSQNPSQVAQMQTRGYQALPMAGLAGI